MKQVLAIFLIFLLSIGLAGYLFIFKIEQFEVRRDIKYRIKHNIPHEKLHVVKCEENEIEWEQAGKEFWLKGELYDIVYIDTVDKKPVYHCINDTEEKSLFEKLDELVLNELNNKSLPLHHKSASLLKILSSIVYIPNGDCQCLPSYQLLAVTQTQPVFSLAEFHGDILHPPRF